MRRYEHLLRTPGLFLLALMTGLAPIAYRCRHTTSTSIHPLKFRPCASGPGARRRRVCVGEWIERKNEIEQYLFHDHVIWRGRNRRM